MIEVDQAVIAAMKATRTARESYRAIAFEPTRRVVPTKKGNGAWIPSAVASATNVAVIADNGLINSK